MLNPRAARLYEEDFDDPGNFDRLTSEDQAWLLDWIARHVRPARKRERGQFKGSSYLMKHLAEHDWGRYVSNGEMKGAMLAASYHPKDPAAKNWRWAGIGCDADVEAAIAGWANR